MKKIIPSMIAALLIGVLLLPGTLTFAVDKINVTLPSKSFQFIIFPLAKQRGYMKEEGSISISSSCNLPTAFEAVLACETDFTGSGSSARVAVMQNDAPLKTVLAVTDQVLQWLMVRPQYSAFKDLKNKKDRRDRSRRGGDVYVEKGCAKVRPRRQQGFDISLAPLLGQRLAALQTVEAGRRAIQLQERFAALDQGIEEDLVSGQRSEEFLGHHCNQ